MNPIESKIITFFENLSPSDLKILNTIYTESAFFKDPFNEFSGLSNIEKIYSHMYESLNEPKFRIIDSLFDEDKQSLFLTWDFIFNIKSKEFIIHGSTFFKLNKQGLITYHRDYWDVGEELLSKIPVMKTLYKFFSSKLKV